VRSVQPNLMRVYGAEGLPALGPWSVLHDP